ncbi:MAG: hypothetical protein ACRDAS_06395, partial [Cetobacterium sp.]
TVGKDNDISLIADIDRGDKVVITITATINPKAVGIIPKNVVTVGEIEKETPKIDPEKGSIQFTKEIVKGKEYTQGGIIEYKLTITNPNKTFVNDVSFIDEISKIEATDINEDQVTAFKSWTVERTDNGTGSTYTQLAEITVDINDKIDISPNDVIVYTVKGIVNENIVGDIVNTGYVEYVGPEGVEKLEKSVTSENVPGTVIIVKEPISPNYLPDGEIGFTVVVANTSTTSVASNITIKDSISGILAKKVGGEEIAAFEPGWTITAVLEGSEANSNITALEGIEAGKDINALIDLGKDTKVTITIKGKAAKNIYGDIINIATFDYPEAKDEAGKTGKDDAVIKNTSSTPELTKIVDKPTYNSGETLEYTITIKNPGKSIIPGFELTDEIGKIIGEISGEDVSTGLAFDSWERISIVVPETSSLLSEPVKNSVDGDTYKAVLDLAPGDEIVVKLAAKTKVNVFGELKNKALGKYKEIGPEGPEVKNLEKEVVSTGKIGALKLDKSVKTNTRITTAAGKLVDLYSPGEVVEYTFIVTNDGDGWVRNAKLEDIFTDVKVKLYPSGVEGAAFDSGTLQDIKFESIPSAT